MQCKGQSAIEFLTVYSTVFLIIAIVLAALFIYVNVPISTIPSSCNFYSDFICQDSILSSNGTGGTTLFLLAYDSTPGVFNISGFTSTLNGQHSTFGYCAPNVTTSGERLYCVAEFKGTPNVGSTYSGTFGLYANFCTSGTGNLVPNCPASSGNYLYGGNVRLQAQGNAASLVEYANINLDNMQGAATPQNFDQMISFDGSSAAAKANETPDLGNIRFYYRSNELYSWCESNCSTSSTGNATFWVRIPQGIPADRSINITMYFMPVGTDYSGVYAGEAPELSSSYGEYDNGDEVFALYQDFDGTSTPSGWLEDNGAVQNNGITVSGSSGYAVTSATYGPSSSRILDFYGRASGSASECGAGFQNSSGESVGDQGMITGYLNPVSTSDYVTQTQNASGAQTQANLALALGTNAIFSLWWPSASGASASYNYANLQLISANVPAGPLSIGVVSQSGSASCFVQWLRLRTYPPNGAMPQQKIGAIKSAT
jgi:hypothetical protein